MLTNTYDMRMLQPAFPAQYLVLPEIAVRLAPSTVYPMGCLLGEITATPGVYGLYVAANTDGTQNAKLLMHRACSTDVSSNVSFAPVAVGGEWGQVAQTAPAYFDGVFRTLDLLQTGPGSLDVIAVTKTDVRHIGMLTQGTLANGLIKIGN